MFDILTLWLIIWVVKNAAVDVSCAVTGKPNPRYELKKAKAKAAGQPAPVQPRYGGKDWFADLLSDGLQAQTERRRAKAEHKRREHGAPDTDGQDQDTTGEPGDDGQPDHRPAGEEQAGPRRQPNPEPEPEPGANTRLWNWQCARRPDCPARGFGFTTEAEAVAAKRRHEEQLCLFRPGGERSDQQHGVGEQTWSWACARAGCSAGGAGYPSERAAVTAADRHEARCRPAEDHTRDPQPQQRPQPRPAGQPADTETSGPATGGEPGPEQSPTPRPTEPAGNGPSATVIPFPTKPQEVPVSTDVNAEIVGLDQSIAYAQQLAAFAGEHGAAGNEGYLGHLTESQVSGEALTSAGEMQEAFANAQAAAERHAEILEQQRAVQEAYDNAPDAGDKSFMQEGR